MHSVFDVYISFLICQRKLGSIFSRVNSKIITKAFNKIGYRSVSLKLRVTSDFTLSDEFIAKVISRQ